MDGWVSESFFLSKNLILENDLLVHYDPNKPIGIVCDSSSCGIGAVLFHVIDGHERSIMFTSCTLSAAEKNCTHLHKEL